MTTTVDHVGLSVPDIEAAIKWYSNTFDLFQISDVIKVNCKENLITFEIIC